MLRTTFPVTLLILDQHLICIPMICGDHKDTVDCIDHGQQPTKLLIHLLHRFDYGLYFSTMTNHVGIWIVD